MPVTTIKRCQAHPDYWYTVEDCNVEICDDPGTGLTVKYFDDSEAEGGALLAVSKEDALLIRDAINQLYPPQ